MASDRYLPYINHLRGLAIVLIVAFHCKTSFDWGTNHYQEKFWFSLIVYGTIVFVFISGFLFQHIHQKQFHFKSYFIKKLKYVLLPYIIVSIPAIINKLYFDVPEPWQSEYYKSLSPFLKAVYLLATGKHLGPFWFIPMITIVYLISPLLIYLDRNKYFYSYLFPIIFLAGLFVHDFGHNTSVLGSFIYFLPVYILGMWASKNEYRIVNLSWAQLSPLIVIYIIIFAMELMDVLAIGKTYGFAEDVRANAYLFNFGKLKMIILCIILMNLLFRLGAKRIQLLELLAQYSFGVFFIHLYILRILEKLVKASLPDLTFNSIYFIAYILVVTGLSMLIIYLTKLALGNKSRYLLGS